MTGTFWLLTVFTATYAPSGNVRGSASLTCRSGAASTGRTISKLETHKSLNPTIDTLCRYAAALGKDIGLTLEEHKPMQARRITMGKLRKGAEPS